jgi:hypothetical protein
MMRKLAVGCLAAFVLGVFVVGASAQSQRDFVRELIGWVKTTGKDGVLEGRLAKALGIGTGEDVSVKTQRLVSRNGASVERLMVPVGDDVIVVRSLNNGQEILWKASVIREQEIATLEAMLFVDWTGNIRNDKVNAARGDDGFFARIKQWDIERKKIIKNLR